MNKLNKLYKAILEALGCKIKTDASIVMVNANKEYPVKVDDKQTYLPTNDAMNVVDTERAFFHPACESITSKETEMDKVLRKLVTSCVYFSFKPIAAVLLKVANKNNKGLTGKMVERFKPLKGNSKEVDAEIIDLVGRISMQTEFEGADTRIVNYTLMRGGKTENDEHIYYRCVPSFPFYNELTRVINQNSGIEDEGTVIFNEQRYRAKTLRVVQAIFEIAMPYVEDPSRAEAVALNPVAARLTALMRCFGHIASELNGTISKFRKDFDEIGMYGIETSWVETLDDLPELAYLIPPLDYNNYNTAGKQQDPTQDLQYNLFNVVSEQRQQQNQYPQTTYPNNNQQVKGAPNPPPRIEGETYRGMTVLPNGLYEYTFQNGSTLRVVCTDGNGQKITEQYTGTNGQPFNQSGWNNNGYGMMPTMMNPMNAMNPMGGMGTIPMMTLPNGTIVPVFVGPSFGSGTDYSNNNNQQSAPMNNGFQSSGQMTGVEGNFN